MGDVEIKLDFAATQIEQARSSSVSTINPSNAGSRSAKSSTASTAETRCRSSGAASSCGSARNE